MADLQEDTEDSRTLLAGRKRDFEPAAPEQHEVRAMELSDGEALDQHVEGSGEASGIDVASIQNSSLQMLDLGRPSVENISTAMGVLQQSPAAEPQMPTNIPGGYAIGTEETMTPQVEAQITTAPLPKISWNSGAQSGLRTSFGPKKSRSIPLQNFPASDIGLQIAQTASNQQEGMDVDDHTELFREHSPSKSDIEGVVDRPFVSNIKGEAATGEAATMPQESISAEKRKARELTEAAQDQPIPFKKLKNYQRDALSEEQRAAYDRALFIWLNEQRKVRREQKKVMKRLNKEQAAKGGPIQSSLTSGKDLIASPRNKPEKQTAAVAALLAEVGWPLPYSHEAKAQKIYNGMTFYPRWYDRPVYYHNKKVQFVMPFLLDHRGLPVLLHDVNFHDFAIEFLVKNQTRWTFLSPDSLSKAFDKYINFYYANIGQFATLKKAELRKTASKENGAGALEQAIAEATQRIVSAPFSSANVVEYAKPSASILRTENEKRGADDTFVIEDDDLSENVDSSNQSSSSDEEVIDLDLDEMQIFLQKKYYPSSAGRTAATSHCLACSQIGHDCLNCPAMFCSACGEKHSTFRCPTQQHCPKCRGLGHGIDSCHEKLSVPRSEVCCDWCGSNEHLEIACHRIWRSFNPKSEEIFTVQNVPVDCYSCGGSNHFGPECGLSSRRGLFTSGSTWSKENLRRYVDPTSDRRALSAGIDYSVPKRNFSIKGKANDPITFDDSGDDDGQSFIRPKIQPAGRGYIRLNERQESGSMNSIPRRPSNPIAPFKGNDHDGGFLAGDEPRHDSGGSYCPSDDLPPHASVAFHLRPRNGGVQGGSSYRPVPSKRGENSDSVASGRVNKKRPRGSKNERDGGRGRGRGRDRGR